MEIEFYTKLILMLRLYSPTHLIVLKSINYNLLYMIIYFITNNYIHINKFINYLELIAKPSSYYFLQQI